MDSYELKRTDSICQTPEFSLLQSVKCNDVNKISSIVVENPRVLSTVYGHPYNKPILYVACFELADTVESYTIQTLIDLGANLYYCVEADDYMQALHFATLGENPSVLETIVRNLKRDAVNGTTKNGNTALNLLIKQGNAESRNFEKCLRILLSSNIEINKANSKNVTPILWAAHKAYKNVLKIILTCGKFVDIDTHKIRGKTARMLIVENNLYDGNLPQQNTNNNESETEMLHRYIKEDREEEFLQFGNIEKHIDDEHDGGTLLQLACERNLRKIVEHLIQNGSIVDRHTQKNKEYPIEIAAKYGYFEIFEILLRDSVKIENLLTILLKNVDSYTSDVVDHQKCLKLLLRKKDDVSVNVRSSNGNTPLHLSTRYADPEITLELLRRGASLGNKNSFDALPIEDVDPVTLEEHFNDCINAIPKTKFDKQSTVVSFDYNTLIPKLSNVSNVEESTDVEANCGFLETENRLVFETEVVNSMSKIPELRHLLKHPLITSFLYIKWHRMRWFFYTNLLFYTIFCALLVLDIFLCYSSDVLKDHQVVSSAISFLLTVAFVALLLREFFQVVLSPRTYFFHFENWLEIALLLVTSFIIFERTPETSTVRQLSSIAILLAALELMLLIGQHPYMSTNIVMLRTVSYNFFKFLLWYAILILAFALSFYTLFNKEGETDTSNNKTDTANKTDEKDQEQDFFEDPGLTMIKTIVMLTGEFDAASSINFEPLSNRIIFLLFVFMIAIILFNLLNGLAVSDTQMIKNDAEIVGHIERISHIVYIENMMLGNFLLPANLIAKINSCCCCLNLKLGRISVPFAKLICLFPEYLRDYKLLAYLNQRGKVITEKEDGCLGRCKSIYLDSKTIKSVKQLLQARKKKDELSRELKAKEEIIRHLRQTIETQQNTISALLMSNTEKMR